MNNLLKNGNKAFTLIELLVVIAIIGVLSTIGITVFTGARTSSNDARRKADIDAIAKAYESKFDPTGGTYSTLADSDFNGGVKPKDPKTSSDYLCTVGPSGCSTTATDKFQVCATLEGGSLYCKSSTQGSAAAAQVPAIGAAGSEGVSCPNVLNTPADGLVGYWNIEPPDTAGNIIDSSGNTSLLPGILTNATINPDEEIPNSTQSVQFNGTTAYMRVADASPTRLSNNAITLSFWVKPLSIASSGTARYERIISKTSAYQVVMFNNQVGAGKLQLKIYNTTGVIIDVIAATDVALAQGAWHHVVITYDSGNANIYITPVSTNITAIKSTSSGPTTLATNTNQLNIGASTLVNEYFNGLVDKVRIYNKALTPQEIGILYFNGNGC